MADYVRSYRIEFPRQPIQAVVDRMKAAGMKYTKAPPVETAHGPQHAGLSGHWEGKLTSAQLTTLDLPAETTIEQL